ncbi:type II toxin-antitoxin system VapC family toxin [Dyadobacter frigoris]|uniref:Type II toxin-antitoxin system VapC family toxin n=1 Tax=Dyadobacter frigoris TaxID=2576211 RepID=A0A4U6D9F9_9BACT|nr:type II toxin-antitoxin system VapC family toxin [Dyadobacter frigoris]TKT94119.1 type II toxin-antitoxin system VapC family toxin [Dyadobacter frigoris]GLU50670.1 twitching motility protein PilT [Dyadobacter frigoris]
MKYLIDTQILIWFQLDDKRLSNEILSLLMDVDNFIYVSMISLYEIAIKQKTGKLSEFPASIEDIISVSNQDGFEILPITEKHISNYSRIPLSETHKDPFDRLILSTALTENLIIISADDKFKLYTTQIELIIA